MRTTLRRPLPGQAASLAIVGILAAIALFADARAQAPGTAKAPSTVIPVPREGGAETLHKKFLEQAKKGNIDLLFLGDSITRGWAGKDKNGEGPKEIWERFYAPRHTANFGIGGDRTQHVLWRIENGELEGISPKVLILMIGTNNAHDNSADEIAEGIERIVKTIHTKLPATKVLLLGVFPRGHKPNAYREKLDAVNLRIAKLDDGKTVKFLDLGKHFLNANGTISEEVMPDYLHLSRRGYRIWAEAMEPTLWSLLEEPSAKKAP